MEYDMKSKTLAMVLVCAMFLQFSSGLFAYAQDASFINSGSGGGYITDSGAWDSVTDSGMALIRDSGAGIERTEAAKPFPAGFLTGVGAFKEINSEGVGIPFTGDVPRDAGFVVQYTYKIPAYSGTPPAPQIVHDQPYYFDMPQEVALKDPVPFEIMSKKTDADGNETTYTAAKGTAVTASGKVRVTITFTAAALDNGELEPGVPGEFWFGASFDKSKIENNGDAEIDDWGNGLADVVTIPFAVDELEAEVEIDKATTGAVISPDVPELQYTIPWVVTLTPTITNAPTGGNKLYDWVVTDTITDYHQLVNIDGTMPYEIEKAVLVEQTVAGATTDVTGGTPEYDVGTKILSYAFPDSSSSGENYFTVPEGASYTLTFRTKFTPTMIADPEITTTGSYTFRNEAETTYKCPAYGKDKTEGSITYGHAVEKDPQPAVTKTADAATEISGGSMTKSGALTQSMPDTEVEWTIKVTNSLNLASPFITDVLPAKTSLIGAPKLGDVAMAEDEDNSESPGEYIADTVGGQQKLTFYLNAGTDKQEITYVTRVENGADVNLINEAEFHAGDGAGLIFTKEATVPLNNRLMTKGGKYEKLDHTIDWTIRISSAGKGLKNVVLTDVIQEDQEYVNGTLKAEPAAKSAAYDVDTKTITVDYTNATGIGGNEVVTYQTRLTDDENVWWATNTNSFKPKNSVTLTDSGMVNPSFEVTGTAPATSKVLEKECISYDFTTHRAKWKLTVNDNQMALDDVMVRDEIVTEGWTFVEDTVTVEQDDADVTIEKLVTKAFESGMADKPVMTLTLADMAMGDAPYVITYYTELAEDKLYTNKKVKIENEATLTGDVIPEGGVIVTAYKDVGGTVLEKSGEKDSLNRQIKWEVLINKNHISLKPAGQEALTVSDTLEAGLELDLASVLLEEYNLKPNTDGTKPANWEVGAELVHGVDYTAKLTPETGTASNIFEITFLKPVTKAYKLSFATDVVDTSKNYTNKITFKGGAGADPGGTSGIIDIASGGGWTGPANMAYLRVIKTAGESGTPLAGAEFTLGKTPNAVGLLPVETDADGVINFKINLLSEQTKDFWLTETKAPAGFVLNPTPQKITLEKDAHTSSNPLEKTIENDRVTGDLIVTKTDDKAPAMKLDGAEFTLKKTGTGGITLADTVITSGKTVAVAITGGAAAVGTPADGTSGEAKITGLPVGSYTVTETKAPAGYLLNNNNIYRFEVKDTADTSQTGAGASKYTFTDTKITGGVKAVKLDDKTGAKLDGAEFSVKKTSAGGTKINAIAITGGKAATVTAVAADGTVTSAVSGGTAGEALITGLPAGTYEVTEAKAPAGYLLNTTAQSFTIAEGLTAQPSPVVLNFKDTKIIGEVQITKTDDVSGEKLAGAEFAATKTSEPDTGKQWKAVTGADGTAVLNLPEGTYNITELKAPKGYVLNTSYKQAVTIAASGAGTKQPAPQSFSAANTLILGGLELTKTDLSGTVPLAGAKIALYRADDTLVDEKTTPEDGKLRFDKLTAGSYYYKETEAPAGYRLDETKHLFTIETHEQLVSETLKNTPNSKKPENSGGHTPPPPPQVITPPPIEGGGGETVPPATSGIIEKTPSGTPSVAEPPKNGTVTVEEDGKWSYTPNPGYTGDDEFTVKVTYPGGYTESFIIKLSVLSSAVPFFPDTGEASRVPFYVCGAGLIAAGIFLRRRVRKI